MTLVERTLVPYFDAPVDGSSMLPLQKKQASAKNSQGGAHHISHAPAHKHHRNITNGTSSSPTTDATGSGSPAASKTNSRKGKGKKQDAEKAQQAAHNPAPNARKHHRDPSHKHLPYLASSNPSTTSGRASPPRKRQEGSLQGDVTGPARQPLTPRFAGPAFVNSPMPDSLPIPATLLGMQDTADRMRSGLVL